MSRFIVIAGVSMEYGESFHEPLASDHIPRRSVISDLSYIIRFHVCTCAMRKTSEIGQGYEDIPYMVVTMRTSHIW